MAKNNNGDRVQDIITNLEERKKFKQTLYTITHYMQRIDDEKDAIKETVDDLSANTGIDKKLIRKLATTMYKRDYESRAEENQHFEMLWDMLIISGSKTSDDPLDEADVEESEETDSESE